MNMHATDKGPLIRNEQRNGEEVKLPAGPCLSVLANQSSMGFVHSFLSLVHQRHCVTYNIRYTAQVLKFPRDLTPFSLT